MSEIIKRLPETSMTAHESNGRTDIDSRRRLVPTNDIFGIREFYDNSLDSIVIALPVGSEQATVYENLLVHNLPVFSGTYSDKDLILSVPSGTRLLSQELKFLSRDIPNYSEIFVKFGETLREINRAGLGLPVSKTGRPLLANFAFSPAGKDTDGGIIFLSPPYELDTNVSINHELDLVNKELDHSVYFKNKKDAVQKLMGKLATGLGYGRND